MHRATENCTEVTSFITCEFENCLEILDLTSHQSSKQMKRRINNDIILRSIAKLGCSYSSSWCYVQGQHTYKKMIKC